MNQEIVRTLCEWSKTINPQFRPKYAGGVDEVLAFVRMPDPTRRDRIREYGERYCLRNFDEYHASGIYLLFRLAFDLPKAWPRSEARVFGGWLHPSVGDLGSPFDLSWPVARVDAHSSLVEVARFHGYSGKGYDALGEYEYLANHFHLRSETFVSRMTISSE
jgi:hypothetical protein